MITLKSVFYLLSVILLFTPSAVSVELTFELLDNARDCFYEDIKTNTSVTFEFQVVTGGAYDVDVLLAGPDERVIQKWDKTQFDSFTFNTVMDGVYAICFSNEFSTFSHKLVYMDLQVGSEPLLPGLGEHVTVMTQMETSVHHIHKAITTVSDYQTHHRLQEASSRKRAEDLNERVMLWSAMETLTIVIVVVGQVLILKNFFSEKRPLNK